MKINENIKTEAGKEVRIIKYIGSGGQGEVYQVNCCGTAMALKWYTNLGKDPEKFRDNLIENIQKGSPNEAFLWPRYVTEWSDNTFGYIMELKKDNYYPLTDYLNGKVTFVSWKTRIDACLNILAAFRTLHNRGYCYQDVNDGSFFINPQTGKIQISDNDNILPDGGDLGMMGKPSFMAPEIVRENNLPSIASDRYSLAVLLFYIICGGHPLEGKYGLPKIMTEVAIKRIYGEHPIFIYDSCDESNRPIKEIQKNVVIIWNLLPDYMQSLFQEAFSQSALMDVNKRYIEITWIKVLARFRGDILICKNCHTEVFVKDRNTKCDSCGSVLNEDYWIAFRDYVLPAEIGMKIYKIQCGFVANPGDELEVLGVVVKSKSNGKMAIINQSNLFWSCKIEENKSLMIKNGERLPFIRGLSIDIGEEKSVLQIK